MNSPDPRLASGDGGAAIQGDLSDSSGPGPRLMTASTLAGDEVVNRAGEQLGKVEEVMLDVTQGRIAYAVMSSGGFLGMGEKLFAIPWAALTLDTDRHCFVLDADRATFEDAPGFDKDRWPDAPDASWHRQVHEHFRSRPYWGA